MDESIRKIQEVLEQNSEFETSTELDMANTQNQPTIENTQKDTHPGKIYHASLGNTISKKRNKNKFYKKN